MTKDDKSSRFGISARFRREALIMAGLLFVAVALGLLAAIFGPILMPYVGGP